MGKGSLAPGLQKFDVCVGKLGSNDSQEGLVTSWDLRDAGRTWWPGQNPL